MEQSMASLEKEEREKTDTWKTTVLEKLQELSRGQAQLESHNRERWYYERQQAQQRTYQWALHHLITFDATNQTPLAHSALPRDATFIYNGNTYIAKLGEGDNVQTHVYYATALVRDVLFSFMRGTCYVVAMGKRPASYPPALGITASSSSGEEEVNQYVTVQAADGTKTKGAQAAFFQNFVVHPILTLCGCCPHFEETADGVYTISPPPP
eukprot:9355101-Pyramimonas_sp.AAC.1